LRDVIATVPEFKGIEVIFRAVTFIKGEHGDQEMSVRAIKYIKELDPLVDAFIKPNDQMGTRRHFAEVVNTTATKPLFGITKADVMKEWGATAVVYPSHESIGRQAASMIHHIFKGGKPADIVPEWPRKFGFAVDLRKTRRFQIKVPIEILRLSGKNIIK
jgi:putative ABC transport system substrate-binding protein